MKNFLVFLLLGAILSSCADNKQDGMTRIRYIAASSGGEMILLEELLVADRRPLDSVALSPEGEAVFRFKPEDAGFYLISRGSEAPITLFIEPGEDLNVTDRDDHGDIGYAVEGSPGSGLLHQYFIRKIRDEALIDSLGKIFRESQSRDDFPLIREQLDSQYYALLDDHKAYLENLILEHDQSIVSLFLVNQRFGRQPMFDDELDLALLNRLDSALFRLNPVNVHVQAHHARMTELRRKQHEIRMALERLSPGMSAPDLTIPDIDGHPWKLSSMTGSKCLLHFWAAVDARSRRDNLALVPFVKSHPELKVVSISMDVNRETWQAAARLDGLSWTQVSELAGLTSPAADLYLPEKELPRYFLIDAEGKIMAQATSILEIGNLSGQP